MVLYCVPIQDARIPWRVFAAPLLSRTCLTGAASVRAGPSCRHRAARRQMRPRNTAAHSLDVQRAANLVSASDDSPRNEMNHALHAPVPISGDGIRLLERAAAPDQSSPPPAYPASKWPRQKARCATKALQHPVKVVTREYPNPIVYMGVVQDMGWKEHMEDRYSVLHQMQPAEAVGSTSCVGSLAAVFDGHYGQKAVEFASTHVPREVAAHPLLWSVPGGHEDELAVVEEVMKSVYSKVDDSILAAAREQPTVWRDGSTALTAFVRGKTLFTANAGDCRAVMCRNREALRITRDHTVHDQDEKQRITESGGRLHFMRGWRVLITPRDGLPCRGLNVTRGFGDYHFKDPLPLLSCTPDVKGTTLEPGDSFIILASDGLWGAIGDDEAVAIVQEELQGCRAVDPTPGAWEPSQGWAIKASRSLVERALERGSIDNITAMVILLDWPSV